jgi:hypothetical protein
VDCIDVVCSEKKTRAASFWTSGVEEQNEYPQKISGTTTALPDTLCVGWLDLFFQKNVFGCFVGSSPHVDGQVEASYLGLVRSSATHYSRIAGRLLYRRSSAELMGVSRCNSYHIRVTIGHRACHVLRVPSHTSQLSTAAAHRYRGLTTTRPILPFPSNSDGRPAHTHKKAQSSVLTLSIFKLL